MTDLLLRLFTGDCDPSSPAYRTRVGFLASITCIACNIVLCAAKAAVGVLAGSVSIVADAVNNLSDASSNIVSLLGFKLASKPADEGHPYGHGRYEYLAGLAVAVIVSALGLDLVKESVGKIFSPEPSEFSTALVAVLLGSMAVKFWMMLFNRSLGRRIDSETLIATAADSRNDVVTTGVVLACAAIGAMTGVSLDGWAGVGVGAFITASGIGLIRDTVSPLLGEAPDPEMVAAIEKIANSYEGVLGLHDLAVHNYGPGKIFASLHVEVDAAVNVMVSHDMIDNIEHQIARQLNIHCTVHMDPINLDDPNREPLKQILMETIASLEGVCNFHDLRIVPGPTHTNVVFDVAVSPECKLSDEELSEKLSDAVTDYNRDFHAVIEFDRAYVE